MSINELQDGIIEEFEAFDDWIDRYQLIIDYAKELNGRILFMGTPPSVDENVGKNLPVILDAIRKKVTKGKEKTIFKIKRA